MRFSTQEPMASTFSPPAIQAPWAHRLRNAHPAALKPEAAKPPATPFPNRRLLLFFLPASTALTALVLPSKAADIPLFGLRNKLRSAEETAVEIVKEGFETAERGLETAERGLETVERGIESAEKRLESAEKGIQSAVSFDALAQAGAVAAAELIGVVVATSVVNGILGPEAQKS